MEKMLEQLKKLNIDARKSLPLAPFSSFRIGGTADLAVFPTSCEELLFVLELLRGARIPWQIIGNASNVLFSDEGFRGVIVFTTAFRTLCVKGQEIKVGAGTLISNVATAARDASLTGAEFLYGIPGSVGGAVFMNAGAYGGSLGDVCIESEYFDMESGLCGVSVGEEQAFSYRSSIYMEHPERVVLGARFRLCVGERDAITASMKELMERRKSTQPLEYPSAGSVFKRPEGHFAGKLIEDCGLKGLRIGGAEVSAKHAGFIVNRSGATARDVRLLIEHIRETVMRETGVSLECEIRFL